ncbi:hypothetical protein JYB64_10540 [Algoriphagus aestuarii]|nr:hypothetical protein [Algoriphagus aestuarii]
MTKSSSINVTVEKGGTKEFEKTGVYPQYLVFNSKDLKKRWKHKLSGETKQGILAFEGKVLFQYQFDGIECSITDEIGNAVDVEMSILMKD